MEVCRLLLTNNATVAWSEPDEYFQSKCKPDADSITIKARLQLVHEWNSQREKGNSSFKLPIEVFRRGATDIATYYSALTRGGRSHETTKTEADAIEEQGTTTLGSILAEFDGMSTGADENIHETADDDLDMPSLDFDLSLKTSLLAFTTTTLTSCAPLSTSKSIQGGSTSPRIIGGGSAQSTKRESIDSKSEPSYRRVIGGGSASFKRVADSTGFEDANPRRAQCGLVALLEEAVPKAGVSQ